MQCFVLHMIKQQNKVIAALCTIIKQFSFCFISDRRHFAFKGLFFCSIMSASEETPIDVPDKESKPVLPVPVGTPEAKHPPVPVENPYSAKALEAKRALEQAARTNSEETLEMNPPTIDSDEEERLRQKIGKKRWEAAAKKRAEKAKAKQTPKETKAKGSADKGTTALQVKPKAKAKEPKAKPVIKKPAARKQPPQKSAPWGKSKKQSGFVVPKEFPSPEKLKQKHIACEFDKSVPEQDRHDGVFSCEVSFNKDNTVKLIKVLRQDMSNEVPDVDMGWQDRSKKQTIYQPTGRHG